MLHCPGGKKVVRSDAARTVNLVEHMSGAEERVVHGAEARNRWWPMPL